MATERSEGPAATVLAREAVWTNADSVPEDDRAPMGAFVGIDLGTSNSCLGLWHPGKNRVKIIKNRHDEGRTTPSVVYYQSEDNYVVGMWQSSTSWHAVECTCHRLCL